MFSNPELNIKKLGLREGMRVADFGAGTGMYSKAVSKIVGDAGKVYAIEVIKNLVKKLENEISNEHLPNIEVIWGDIEEKHGTKIADHILDAVIVSNVLFQVPDKLGLIDEAKRILRKGGKLLFIDWSDSFNSMGPIADDIITPDKAVEMFTSRGFKLLENIIVSDHHYGIIFIYE